MFLCNISKDATAADVTNQQKENRGSAGVCLTLRLADWALFPHQSLFSFRAESKIGFVEARDTFRDTSSGI